MLLQIREWNQSCKRWKQPVGGLPSTLSHQCHNHDHCDDCGNKYGKVTIIEHDDDDSEDVGGYNYKDEDDDDDDANGKCDDDISNDDNHNDKDEDRDGDDHE